MTGQSSTVDYQNPNDFELIKKLRSNDLKTIADIFEAKNPRFKERYRKCMMRAKGIKEEHADPPNEWLQELKYKMMENNWGEDVHEVTKNGKTKKKVGCWGSLLNFDPTMTTFEQWFFGEGEWYEDTTDCVAFRFFLIKSIMESDTWATCYIFNLILTKTIPGKSEMEKTGQKKAKNWKPPKSYYIGLFLKIITKLLPEKITRRSFDEMLRIWGNDLWANLSGIDKNDYNTEDKWAKLLKYDPTLCLHSWLFFVAVRFSVRNYYPQPLFLELSKEIEETYSSESDQNTLNEYAWLKLFNAIQNEIDSGDLRTKKIVEGKMNKKPSKTIASELNTTVNAVDKAFHHWKEKIKKKYDNLYTELYI